MIHTHTLHRVLLAGTWWLLCCCACDDGPIRDPLDYEYNQLPLWESEPLYINPKEGVYTGKGHLMEITPIHNHITMVGVSDANNDKYFIGLDLRTGKKVWTSSYKNKRSEYIMPDRGFQHENFFYFYGDETPGGKQETPWLKYNITTGELVYRKTYPELFIGGFSVKHLNNTVVSLETKWKDPDTGLLENRFWIHPLDAPDSRIPLVPPRSNNYTYNGTGAGIIFFELASDASGDVFLIYRIDESLLDEETGIIQKHIHSLNCYNLTQQQWVYQHKPCQASGGPIPIKDDLIYFDGGYKLSEYPDRTGLPGLWAYEWKTGELVWYTPVTAFDPNPDLTFTPTGMGLHQGTLVFSSVSYAYGVDARTGAVKWKKKGIGNTNSPFLFHQGVAYVASANGFLHGWEVETGKELLRARCPRDGDHFESDIDGLRGPIPGFLSNIGMHVDSDGKAVFIVRNFLHAYAFDAVK